MAPRTSGSNEKNGKGKSSQKPASGSGKAGGSGSTSGSAKRLHSFDASASSVPASSLKQSRLTFGPSSKTATSSSVSRANFGPPTPSAPVTANNGQRSRPSPSPSSSLALSPDSSQQPSASAQPPRRTSSSTSKSTSTSGSGADASRSGSGASKPKAESSRQKGSSPPVAGPSMRSSARRAARVIEISDDDEKDEDSDAIIEDASSDVEQHQIPASASVRPSAETLLSDKGKGKARAENSPSKADQSNGAAASLPAGTTDPAAGPFDVIWAEAYAPTTLSELSVHKKKVDEVAAWLREALHGPEKLRKYRRILALSGPSGAGKSALVDVLARGAAAAAEETEAPAAAAPKRKTKAGADAAAAEERGVPGGFEVVSFENNVSHRAASDDAGQGVGGSGGGATGLVEKFAEFVLYASGSRRLQLASEGGDAGRGQSQLPTQPAATAPPSAVKSVDSKGKKSVRFDALPPSTQSAAGASEDGGPRKKVIVLDDLPNLSHGPTKEAFQASLETLLRQPLTQRDAEGQLVNVPVIVIVSESLPRAGEGSGGNSGGGAASGTGGWRERLANTWDTRTVLGDAVRNHPAFAEIKFNPIATTLMKPGLRRIVQLALGASASGADTSSSAGSPAKGATIGKKRKAKSKGKAEDGEEDGSRLAIANLLCDAIAKQSDGDIRSAIHALQNALRLDAAAGSAHVLAGLAAAGEALDMGELALLSDSDDYSASDVIAKSARTAKSARIGKRAAAAGSSSKKKISSKERVARLMTLVSERESSLALWHALGKVLYNKRAGEEKDESERAMMRAKAARLGKPAALPAHMAHLERKLSMVDLEAVWVQVSVEPSNFQVFLHHSYPLFCTEVEQCADIIDQYSFIDARLHTEHESWLHSALTSYYHFSVSTASTMLFLPSPTPRNKQKFTKPPFFDVTKRSKEFADGVLDAQAYLHRSAQAQNSDGDYVHSSAGSASATVFATEILPFLSKLGHAGSGALPQRFRELGRMKSSATVSASGDGGESDLEHAADGDSDDDDTPSTSANPAAKAVAMRKKDMKAEPEALAQGTSARDYDDDDDAAGSHDSGGELSDDLIDDNDDF